MLWPTYHPREQAAYNAGADAYLLGTPIDSPPIYINAAEDLLERWRAGWEWAQQQEAERATTTAP